MCAIIDSKLSWHDHIHHMSVYISRIVGILSKLKLFLPSNILRCIYLILPNLSYCSIIWSSTSKCYLNKLFLLQKKAIRHISKSQFNDHTTPLFCSLNLLKLSDLINTNIATFTFNCIYGNLPNNLSSFFTENNQVHNYNNRRRNKTSHVEVVRP